MLTSGAWQQLEFVNVLFREGRESNCSPASLLSEYIGTSSNRLLTSQYLPKCEAVVFSVVLDQISDEVVIVNQASAPPHIEPLVFLDKRTGLERWLSGQITYHVSWISNPRT